MQVVPISDNKLKPSHVILGLALSAVPVISYPGDFISDFAAIKKAEGKPFKDVFVKTIENHGQRTQKLFGFLKKCSAKKVGTVVAVAGTVLDTVFYIWVVKNISNWIGRRKTK